MCTCLSFGDSSKNLVSDIPDNVAINGELLAFMCRKFKSSLRAAVVTAILHDYFGGEEAVMTAVDNMLFVTRQSGMQEPTLGR